MTEIKSVKIKKMIFLVHEEAAMRIPLTVEDDCTFVRRLELAKWLGEQHLKWDKPLAQCKLLQAPKRVIDIR